ncbi:MAG: signal peptidase I [Ignavibacteriae bacterium]|nr:signal peptidase I [Ignavibacteriota bacterium]
MAVQEKQPRKTKDGTRKQPVRDFLKDTVFVLVSFFFLNSFVLASFEVPTGSMENEIMAGDFLFVNKFIYGGTTPRTIPFTNIRIPWFRVPGFRDVEHGDVIVFEFPGQRHEVQSAEFMFYLKRAIALSGDTVEVINRVVYVNGKPAPIPRNMKFNNSRITPAGIQDPRIFPEGSSFNEDNWGPVVVPKKGNVVPLTLDNLQRWRVFIGREGHSVRLDAQGEILIDGVPTESYVVERNYIFGMGDNRDNSLDGRFWGFIPEENVVGTPMIVYWSWNPDFPLFDLWSKLGSIRLGRIGTIIR